MAIVKVAVEIEQKGDGLKAAVVGLEQLDKKAKSVKDTFKGFGTELTASLQQLGGALSGAGKTLSAAISLPLAGLVTGAATAAISFESAFAGVRKTVDATEAEFKGLEQGFRDLAKTIPTSVNDLARIGEMGGQLGVGKENLLEFTKVIAQMSEATNLTADQAANDFARIANITHLPQKEFSNLGSAIVALGNDGASTESEITAMSLRLAAAGSLAGLSTPQILGFAASLANVGLEAEAGGSAMSKIIKTMVSAVASGGAPLANFAAVARMSVADFKKAFETDAAGAIQTFLKGLSQLSGPQALGALQALGLEEIRTSDTAIRLGQSHEGMAKAMEVSKNAFAANTALSKEAGERYKTMESQLKILWNTVKDAAIELGQGLMPVLKDLVAVAVPLAQKLGELAKWFGTLPEPVRMAVVVVGALVAAIGPLLVVLGAVASGASSLVALGAAATGLGGLAAVAGLAGAAVATLGVALAALWVGFKIGETDLGRAIQGFFHLETSLTAAEKATYALQTAENARQQASNAAILAKNGSKVGLIPGTPEWKAVFEKKPPPPPPPPPGAGGGDISLVDPKGLKKAKKAAQETADEIRKLGIGLDKDIGHAMADSIAGGFGDELGAKLADIAATVEDKFARIDEAAQRAGERGMPMAASAMDALKAKATELGEVMSKTAIETARAKEIQESHATVMKNGADFIASYTENLQQKAAAEQFASDTSRMMLDTEIQLAEAQGDTARALELKSAAIEMAAQAQIRQIAADLESGKIARDLGLSYEEAERAAVARAQAVAEAADVEVAALKKVEQAANLKKIGSAIGGLADLVGGLSTEAGDAADRLAGALGSISQGFDDFANAATGAAKGAAIFAGVANAAASLLGKDSKLGGALSGAASGAKAGAVLGPWGAVIGGVVGGVLGFLKKKKELIIKAAKEAGDGINKAIQDMLSGKGVKDVKSFLPALLKDKKTALALFDDLGKQFAETQEKYKAAILDATKNAVGGLTSMISYLGKKTGDTTADFQRMGTYVMGIFGSLRAQGMGFLEAVNQIKPALDEMQKQADEKGVALTGGAADLVHFTQLIDANKELVAAAEGAGQVLQGLRVSGSLTAETFASMQTDVLGYIADLGTAGFAPAQALAIAAPSLYQLKKAHEDLGLTLDATTQKAIDDADALGLFDGMSDPIEDMKKSMDAMVQVMAAIAQSFGVTLPAAVATYIAELNKIPTIPVPVPGAPGATAPGAPPPSSPGAPPPGIPGHATGLDYVQPGPLPGGGSLHVLHPREMVLKATDAEARRKGGDGGSFTYNGPGQIVVQGSGLTEDQLSRALIKVMRDDANAVTRMKQAMDRR